MVFSPNFSDFSSWIQIFWKKTKINLVSKYFRIYLTEQVGFAPILNICSVKFYVVLLHFHCILTAYICSAESRWNWYTVPCQSWGRSGTEIFINPDWQGQTNSDITRQTSGNFQSKSLYISPEVSQFYGTYYVHDLGWFWANLQYWKIRTGP